MRIRDWSSDVCSSDCLVRSTLRLRPDRIIVGEVRGPEALDMIKAWNTGHPGGIATVHANGSAAALSRIESLVQEAVATVPRTLIADTIDLIVRSEEHTSELQSLMRISYAVFCLKKKKKQTQTKHTYNIQPNTIITLFREIKNGRTTKSRKRSE